LTRATLLAVFGKGQRISDEQRKEIARMPKAEPKELRPLEMKPMRPVSPLALYNLDAERVAATGHSAGGHLASLLGTAGSAKEFDKGDNLELPSRVQAEW
jgi:hypothetical protein